MNLRRLCRNGQRRSYRNRIWILPLFAAMLSLAGCTSEKELKEQLNEANAAVASLEEALSEAETEALALATELEDLKEEKIVSTHGQLSVNGAQLVDQNGEVIQLKGFSTHGLTWYPRYINANAMATTKEYGANVIRLAMYTEQNESYAYEPEQNLTYLYMGVENALSQDMYVIVDWHVLREESPLVYADQAAEFFEEISARYGNEPGIIYEICNEPNGDATWEDVVTYANRIIPIIRKNAPDAVILVGTPNYSSDLSAPMQEPLAYDNIMYVYHSYVDVSVWEEVDLYALKAAVDAELPVFVSEWGISYGDLDDTNITSSTDDSLNFDRARTFIYYMKENNISWCGWSLSNKAESYSAILKDCDKLSGWLDAEDMTPSGRLMVWGLGL